jgi:phage terminase large subunit-like protein
MPFQQDAADVIYELDDDGRLYYSEANIFVPRQSGKTTYVLAKTVHRLTKMARTLGPQRSTYLAQRRMDARKKLELDFAVKLRAARSFPEVETRQARPKRPTQWRMSLNNGMENIQFGAGSFLQIDAPSELGGHGDTLDDATIDEAFAHQNDDAEGALRPAQATRRSAQLTVASTAGHERSFYLWRKILAGRQACETGNHGRVAYVEFSAPDDAPYDDPRTWISCSPALGHTIDIGFIESEWQRLSRQGPSGVDTFRRAYLNQWPVIPSLPEEGAAEISQSGWNACFEPQSVPSDPIMFGVDVAPLNMSASIVVAAESSLGGVHVELLENRPGTDWLVARVAELVGKWRAPVAIGSGCPAWAFEQDLISAGVELVPLSSAEHAQACGSLAAAVRDRELKHRGDEKFLAALKGAVSRPAGDAWLWSRKNSGVDISPLVAVTLARWAHLAAKPKQVGIIVL